MSQEPSLREKIGQMLLLGFRGLAVANADPIARDLEERHVGGVILFDTDMSDPLLKFRNVQSPEQVAALTASLHRRAAGRLLVAIDQEGGRVNRLKAAYGFPESISHEELGLMNDPAQTAAHAGRMAKTLAQAGINLNLAPVVDLDLGASNPIIKAKKRSFSSDPETAARHARAFCQAHHAEGILTCAKHFPGHGSARADTHLGLTDVTAFWSEQELIPFQRLVESGDCDLIMTAHVFNAHLDPERPATLSKAVLQGLLRGRLGYQGVIISDDMEMKAVAAHYGLEQALEFGINAGLDMLCFGNNMSHDANIGEKVCGIIERLVRAGKISEGRIDEAHGRIQRLKRRLTPAT